MNDNFNRSGDPLWERISEVLHRGDDVPPAPDCRQLIKARIEKTQRSAWRTWAFAGGFAAVILLLTLGIIFFMPHPAAPTRQAAANSTEKVNHPAPPHMQRVPKIKHAASEPKKIVINKRPAAVPPLRSPRHRLPMKRIYRKPVPREMNEPLIQPQKPQLAETPKTNIVPPIDDRRPVALAIVKWSPQTSQTQDNLNYSYTKQDTSTGATTKCSIKRIGNSIEIYMETEPADKRQPVKGSSNDETRPDV